jgi:hypothetical protein
MKIYQERPTNALKKYGSCHAILTNILTKYFTDNLNINNQQGTMYAP